MTEIQLEPNDRDDILALLDYALEKKKEDNDKQVPPAYWEVRVPQLKRLIQGYKPFSLYQSSLGGIIKDIEGAFDDIID